jgi:polysaccharide biosynthesis protein PslG
MRRRVGPGAVGATLVVLALIALWPARGGAAVPRTFYGVSPQTALQTADFERMRAGRVGTLRILMNWSRIEPTRGGGYDWFDLDVTVAQAARSGIRILPFMYLTPEWVARDLDHRTCDRCNVFTPRSKAARRAWRRFIRAAVARYGRGGTFWKENPKVPKRPIHAWQIWNEQNSRVFYKPNPSPRKYAKLLRAARKAIRSEDRRADVVLGGMAELAGSPKAMNGSKYLRKLYRVRGVKRDFDGVAPHPYGPTMLQVREQIALVRKQMRHAHDRGADLWVTEIGWSSSEGENSLERGPKGQAKRLRQAFRYFRSRRSQLNVKTVVWFSWMDAASSICEWCQSSGLFAQGLQPKPSWRAFADLTGGK